MPGTDQTAQRDEVSTLALTNTTEALTMARNISDPWFRSQALAHVARYAIATSVLKIAQEAFNIAITQENPYKSVAVSAWPIRALVERDQTASLPPWLDLLVERAAGIDNPVSRSDALLLLWQGAFPFIHSATENVFNAFLQACGSANSWKAGYNSRHALLVVASRDPVRARQLAEVMPESKYKWRTLKDLDRSVHYQPRDFFWVN